ncbi:MAG TPA: COX15/CtaA family protein [Gemmatimonadales bacterium]|jgi:heme A synthase|nr:COX15/CtaA family protein [Gemmatimonadales bacterium]
MRFRRFAWVVLGVNLFVILWGAFVRASGSGAGCGRHWPLCNGQLLPVEPGSSTLIELTHRVTSGVALLLVAVLFWWSRREFPRGHRARRWAGWSLGFISVEALIGAGLVLLALVGANDSLARAGYLAAHLLNTFLLLGSLALTANWAGAATRPSQAPAAGATRWLWSAGLLALLLVGMSGAVTALGDTLFPATSLAAGLRADTSSTAHLLVRLRVLHPVLALLTGAYLALMVWAVGRLRPGAGDNGWARAVVALVLLQLGAGLSNLLLLAPTALQLVHLLLADLLWISVVVFGTTALRMVPTRRVALSESPVATCSRSARRQTRWS